MDPEVYEALWRRAKILSKEAERLMREGEYDLSLMMSEQAARLALKAEIYKLLGEVPKGLNLRRLLTYLADLTNKEQLREFAMRNRDSLIVLEEASLDSRYVAPSIYTREEAEEGIKLARELHELLRQIRG